MMASPLQPQFEAAKRALSIVNKMRPGKFRGYHSSRIMRNMNYLRAGMQIPQTKGN